MFFNIVTKQTEQPMPTQQQTSTVLPTPVASAQPEAAPVVSSSAPSPATQNTTPTTTSAVTTSHSINSGPKSSARGHDEGFHGYSGYHQNSKSSMESLHSRDGRLVHWRVQRTKVAPFFRIFYIRIDCHFDVHYSLSDCQTRELLFCEEHNILSIKSSWPKLASTRRSTALILPF